jgi:ketosteroid isomerase-like protein
VTVMSFQRLIAATAVQVLLSAGAFATPKSEKQSTTIQKTLELLVRADTAAEVGTLANLYSEDVVIVPLHGDPIVGRSRALDETKRRASQFRLKVSLSADATVVKQDTAFVRGRSHGWRQDRQTGEREAFEQNYVAVLRNQCGKWRVARLIWNDDQLDVGL